MTAAPSKTEILKATFPDDRLRLGVGPGFLEVSAAPQKRLLQPSN